MLLSTPHAVLVRFAVCIGRPIRTGMNSSRSYLTVLFLLSLLSIPNHQTFSPLLLVCSLLNCSCHSLLNRLPLFYSLQLTDRIPTITKGILFFLIGISFFEPLAQRVVFIAQKSESRKILGSLFYPAPTG